MESAWKDVKLADYREERVYSSRLLGGNNNLVLHGGGNTSVKTEETDHTGRRIRVLRVKGSGSDLATIEWKGFTGLRMDDMELAKKIPTMTDQEMMDYLKKSMVDPSEPSPSVESFLHAFIPFRFVDHSHSDAILSITNTSLREEEIRKILGNVMVAPYFPPGFKLAKALLGLIQSMPSGTEGIVLSKHGLFTFGETARESYERHVKIVTEAEKYAALKSSGPVLKQIAKTVDPATVENYLPVLRGILSRSRKKVLRVDRDGFALEYACSEQAKRFKDHGPATPDMLIRTKYDYLYAEGIDSIEKDIESFVESYKSDYSQYIVDFPMHDPYPSVIVLKGFGLITAGISRKEADIIHDQAIHSFRVNSTAVQIAEPRFITKREAFEMEYWPLEEAKLKKAVYRKFQGSISVVTGAASGIGAEAAAELARNGSIVIAVDKDPSVMEMFRTLPSDTSASIYPYAADISSQDSVSGLFKYITSNFGGIDVLFNNAGILRTSFIEDTDPESVELSFKVNSMGTFLMTKAAFSIMKAQKLGGNMVFNITKNLTNPGPGMLPYGASKAFAAHICHYVAKEGGPYGIRANIINPDKIFKHSRIWADGVLEKRAAAKHQTVEEYKRSNLLRVEVLPEHVARVLVALLDSEVFGATTDAMIPVDGGII